MNRDVVIRELQKIKVEVEEIPAYISKPKWNRIEIVGIAGIVASIYSGYESIFINLCKNKIKKSERWHKNFWKMLSLKVLFHLKLKKFYKICFHFATYNEITMVMNYWNRKFVKKLPK